MCPVFRSPLYLDHLSIWTGFVYFFSGCRWHATPEGGHRELLHCRTNYENQNPVFLSRVTKGVASFPQGIVTIQVTDTGLLLVQHANNFFMLVPTMEIFIYVCCSIETCRLIEYTWTLGGFLSCGAGPGAFSDRGCLLFSGQVSHLLLTRTGLLEKCCN